MLGSMDLFIAPTLDLEFIPNVESAFYKAED